MTTLDLPSSVVEIDPDIADFLRKQDRDNVFAVNGAIEILRAPLPPGWEPTSIRVQLAKSNDNPLDPQVIQLLTPYKNELAGSGWEVKHRVVSLRQVPSQPFGLHVILVPTTYEEGTGFHRGLAGAIAQGDDLALKVRERLATELIQPGKYSVAGIAGVHVIVITSDDYLVLCKRSPYAGYHPLHWSVSFEEQITQRDLTFGDAALSSAAVRGFQEEFASGHNMALANARTLGVFLEYCILNIGFCVHIEAPLSFEEIEFNWNSKAKDKWENIAVTGEVFTLENVVKLIRSGYYGKGEEQRSEFHPTSQYRLLLAAICRFGQEAVISAFKSL